jgi:hypothetical protein
MFKTFESLKPFTNIRFKSILKKVSSPKENNESNPPSKMFSTVKCYSVFIYKISITKKVMALGEKC